MVFADFVGIIVIVGIIVAVVAIYKENQRRKAVSRAPSGALISSGDTTHEIAAKTNQYKQLLRAVRVLDDQLENADIKPFLPAQMQENMKRIVEDFYDK